MRRDLIDAVQEWVDSFHNPAAPIEESSIDWQAVEKSAHAQLGKHFSSKDIQKAIDYFRY